MSEVWKAVPGYEGLYEVSNMGRVRSLGHIDSIGRFQPGIMKRLTTTNRYKTARLYKNGEGKNIYVHRLVAMAFIPNPDRHPVVNHKDENKFNNCVENLEWCEESYNLNYGSIVYTRIKTYLYPVRPVAQYGLDGVLINKFDSINNASAKTHISRGDICRCCKGQRVTAGGYMWRYLQME